MSTLERAIEIAEEAHEGQKRLDGRPYIVHPMWVMNALEFAGRPVTDQTVGVTHDVVENRPDKWPLARFRDEEGYEDDVIVPLGMLTRDKKIPYDQYAHSLRENETARRVKIYDNVHNLLDYPDDLAPNEWRKKKVGEYSCSLVCLMSPLDAPCGSNPRIINEVREIIALSLDLRSSTDEERLIRRVARAAEMAAGLTATS